MFSFLAPRSRRLAFAVLALALLQLAGLARAQDARGFMWEAVRTAAGGEQRVLLLGTVHVGRSNEPSLTPAQAARVNGADVIAVEADVFDAQRTLAAFQRHAFYPADGPALDAALPAALRARVDKLLPRWGLSPDLVARMKPWALANNLVVLEATRLGFSPAGSTEAQLFALAKKAGKPIVEIESVEAQLALFDAAPAAVQLAYLTQAVESIENGQGEREIRSLLDAWREGDSAGMLKRLDAMRASANAGERWMTEHVIDGRHDAMLAAIERFAAGRRLHVVAVGSLHFFGSRGLLDLLRARGWTVTRLP
jgi:uncharacterized protein YbaP (TraB family)